MRLVPDGHTTVLVEVGPGHGLDVLPGDVVRPDGAGGPRRLVLVLREGALRSGQGEVSTHTSTPRKSSRPTSGDRFPESSGEPKKGPPRSRDDNATKTLTRPRSVVATVSERGQGSHTGGTAVPDPPLWSW